ncbi:tetratricopeptide repeat protein [Candidatus Omnitrophota bacterium]
METRRVTTIVLMLVVIIAGSLVYINSLKGEFIWDDHYLVAQNLFLRDISSLPKIFTEGIIAGAGKVSFSYRPMQIVTYMVDYSIARNSVLVYHISNLVFHLVVGCLIFWLVDALFDKRILSFMTSLLFIVHPIHTEAVSYISGRADMLAGIGILTALICYIRFINLGSFRYIYLSIFAYVFALLARENSFILLGLFFGYHYIFKKRANGKVLGVFICVTLTYAALRATLLVSSVTHLSELQHSLFERIPGLFVAISRYLMLLIAPFNLHMEYGNKVFSILDPRAIAGVIIFISSIALVIKKRGENAILSFGILWFFVTLIPHSNIYPLTAYMAEHWLYLPSIGFFLVVANAGYRLSVYGFRKSTDREPNTEHRKPNLYILAAMVLLITFYSVRTIQQNKYWQNSISFYERTLRYAPESWKVYNDLGFAYYNAGKPKESISLYKKAMGLQPGEIDIYNNMAIAYRALGDEKEAVKLYRKIIKLDPEYDLAYYNLGNYHYDQGERRAAIELYLKALSINSRNAKSYFNLGNAYRDIQDNTKAIEAYKNAIKIDPGYPYPYNNLGIIYYNLGKDQEALKLYEKALSIDKNYAQAYNNLGMVYNKIGNSKKALACFNKSVEADSRYAVAHFNMAVVYYNKRWYDEAAKNCRKSIELGYEGGIALLNQIDSSLKEGAG